MEVCATSHEWTCPTAPTAGQDLVANRIGKPLVRCETEVIIGTEINQLAIDQFDAAGRLRAATSDQNASEFRSLEFRQLVFKPSQRIWMIGWFHFLECSDLSPLSHRRTC